MPVSPLSPFGPVKPSDRKATLTLLMAVTTSPSFSISPGFGACSSVVSCPLSSAMVSFSFFLLCTSCCPSFMGAVWAGEGEVWAWTCFVTAFPSHMGPTSTAVMASALRRPASGMSYGVETRSHRSGQRFCA